jgi:NFU1 iron-sulfur cluster scaffold homolog, mitochondrial
MEKLETTLSVRAEYTPNPNSLKFICSEPIYPYSGSLTYSSLEESLNVSNNLVSRLFEISGITKIFIMSNFISIDKEEEINWKDIHLSIKDIIKNSFYEFKSWAESNAPKQSETYSDENFDSKRQKIEDVLDKIRPALVADGGNIEFVDLVDKDLRLRMVGACGTCPSSLMTMKMGVERALLSEIPDIVETVTQVF